VIRKRLLKLGQQFYGDFAQLTALAQFRNDAALPIHMTLGLPDMPAGHFELCFDGGHRRSIAAFPHAT